MSRHLNLGCTRDRHAAIGVNAIVNARGGRTDLNNPTHEETEQMRDAMKIRQRIESRVRFYQFNSRFFRRHQNRLAHLISSHND